MKILPDLDEIQLSTLANLDVGMDAIDVKQVLLPGPQLLFKEDKSMPMPSPILVVLLCTIPSYGTLA